MDFLGGLLHLLEMPPILGCGLLSSLQGMYAEFGIEGKLGFFHGKRLD
jgi:hypothetical protein